jgi:hypothetical protein
MEHPPSKFGKSETELHALLLSGVDFYLLQSLQDFIHQANMHERKIQTNNRYDQHTTDKPSHNCLRIEIEFRQSYKREHGV